jgi:nuclear-control-of-ATPase protein 2
MSSSASLRLLLRRQDEIIQWIVNIGATIVDFGSNWVVEPIHKLVGTIRHDEKSEIAIMSKNSLLADRASLERMVIDFVRDRPDPDQSHMLGEDTTAITNAVKEGDLTPVLRAYERDLRSPLVGTVRGDLIRALLIQIQKTKVDVEIAISGINALLKSQELVFGFVGLTPGILVSWASLRWMVGLFGNRKGLRRGKRQHELRRGLRNVTRVLTSAPLSDGVMSHKDSGLLIYEAEALLQQVQGVLGGMQYREFREDIQDLLDVERGVDRQLRVVERMRWAYFH